LYERQGWQQWGAAAPQNFASPLRHLNFHASSALHKFWDLYSLFLRRQYDRHCLAKILWAPLTVGTLTALAPPVVFSGAITDERCYHCVKNSHNLPHSPSISSSTMNNRLRTGWIDNSNPLLDKNWVVHDKNWLLCPRLSIYAHWTHNTCYVIESILGINLT